MLFSLGHSSFSCSQKAVQRNRGAREDNAGLQVRCPKCNARQVAPYVRTMADEQGADIPRTTERDDSTLRSQNGGVVMATNGPAVQVSRPRSVTIISWLLIVFGVSNVVGAFLINTGALNVTLGGGILGWGLISAVITIACGVGMLKGENWGRLGYIFLQPLLGLVTGMVTGFVVADSAGLLLFGVVVYLLTREAPSKFFGGPLLRGTKQALAGAISLVTVVALIGTALGSGRSEPSDDRAEEEFRLGMEFFQTDDAKAARWLRRAADHGHEWAQIQLGVMYQEGLGVEQDEVEAVRLYRRAADQGNIIAQTNLAAMYMDGRGVAEVDPETWTAA